MREPGNRGGGGDDGAPRSSGPGPRVSSAAAPASPPPLLAPLALPKGGGAIRGIGEKLEASSATGTGTLSVPIATSPGRGGFELALGLSYASGAGNGPFGLGWSLSVPQLSRKTDQGLPRYGPDSDVFVLSGAEDLVPVRVGGELDADDRAEDGAQYRVQRYRPRVEGLFARLERWTDRASGDVHWRATTRDDVASIYGRSKSARIADPDDARRVFSWLLEESRDDRGNLVRYTYKEEDGAGVHPGTPSEQSRFELAPDGTRSLRPTAQRYLARIEYGNVTPDDSSAFLFEVVFDYGEYDRDAPTPTDTGRWSVRPDPFSDYRPGFEVRTYRLCRRVLVFHRFAELGPEPVLVRSTDFGYREGPSLTYLETVTHAGYARDQATGGYTRQTLPRLTCRYTLPEIHDRLRTIDPASLEGLPGGVDGGRSQWVDLDGEGLPGVLTAHEQAWAYKRNLGGGRLGPPTVQRTLPRPAELAGGVQQLTDLGGDGELGLVQYAPPLAGYFERDAGDWRPFMPLRELPRIDWSDPNLRFLDLDGDGHPDVLITEHDAFVWYRSRAKDGFEPAARVTKPRDERDGPAVIFADGTETIHLADMSGDGLTDLVRVRDREVCYWPNLGHGRFGRKVTMDRSPRIDAPDQFDPRRVLLADVDGSGTTDVIYLGARAATLFLNQAGNGFADGVELRSLPPVESAARVTVVDLLGQGTACLVWSSPLPGDRARPLAYVDLMGGRKPHLLDRIENGLGGETKLHYAPSTQFYLDDQAAGRPWLTRLPFPVQVIERIERIDHIAGSRLVTTYRYHHGYYDGHERELRGFACVETEDAESFSGAGDELALPPVLTKTWFHTGAWLDRDRLETELAREYYAADPGAALLRDTILPPGLSVREEREAARALRGQVLRTEVYALDGAPRSAHPYSVAETNHAIRLLQPAHAEEHAVFLVHPRETVTLHYERDPGDPRVQHELVLAVDDFGNVTRSAALAYPRRQPAEPEQAVLWAAVTDATFANEPARQGPYHIGVPIETRASELTGLAAPAAGLLTLDEARAAVAGAVEIPYEATTTTGALELRTVERQRVYYYRDDLGGRLPLGEIGARAIPHETFALAFTPGLLAKVYGTRLNAAILADEGRYVEDEGLWWAPSGVVTYDPARFFLPVAATDPFGHTSFVRYDAYDLLPRESEDPLGNRITAANDYRVLAPALVTDPNGNRTAAAFDALGMVTASAVMGKEGSSDGDTLAEPTVRIAYDLHRWQAGRLPAVVTSEHREVHGLGETRWQTSYTYVDGTGREVMTKVRTEPGPVPVLDDAGRLVRDDSGAPVTREVAARWVGTGRTVFDNKGNPVKQYEPFWAATSEYEDEAELVESGVTPIFRYDPLGRLIRTDLPDGTHVRVEFDAWEQRSFDANDTVAGTPWLGARQSGTAAEQRAATLSLAHADTPGIARFDPLGRPFLTIVDDGTRQLATRAVLDLEGNTLAVTDARGIETMTQRFDVLGRAVQSRSPDAGELRLFPDVAAKPCRAFSARGHVVRHRYDALGRPTHLFVRDPDDAEILAQRTVYGEAHPEAAARNLRGQAHLVFDGAGVVTSERFDFKGNLLSSTRRLARTYTATPDWSPLAALTDPAALAAAAAPLLEAEAPFATSASYDALDRVTARTTPDGSMTVPTYNEAGLLETLSVRLRGADAATPFVTNIDYNARGQRTRVEHGNGTVTTYAYDPETFRLTHQTLTRPGPDPILQDLGYTYDAAGNLVQVSDAAPFGTAAVSADGLYEYDGLGQLARAEGREHPGQQPTHADPPRLDLGAASDLQALQRYRQDYAYDEAGNLLSMRHRPLAAGGPGAWTRAYAYAPDSNRLVATSAPGDASGALTARYTYDAAGNMITLPHLPAAAWDYANRLQSSSQQVVTTGTPETTYYTYDAAGQRVRKITERQAAAGQTPTRRTERLYLNGLDLHRTYRGDGLTLEHERQTLHVIDGDHRVALAETVTADATIPPAAFTPTTRLRYQAADHLGSSCLELDAAAQIITYEAYHPFGSTAVHAAAPEVSRKRYRYTGQEHDDETGLHYHGARYYAAWLGRWTSADPAGFVDGPNLYRYVRNAPTVLTDPSGHGPFIQGHFVDAKDTPPPPKDLTLPSRADPWVSLDDGRQSRRVTQSSVRDSPHYGDTGLVSVDPRGDIWSLSVEELVFTYADGSTATVPWRSINFDSAPEARAYEQVDGKIFALDSGRNRIFDASNTPNIVAAARLVEDRLRGENYDRIFYGAAVVGFTIPLASLALAAPGASSRFSTIAPRPSTGLDPQVFKAFRAARGARTVAMSTDEAASILKTPPAGYRTMPEFGQKLGWGQGTNAVDTAMARAQSITLAEARALGISSRQAFEIRDAYRAVLNSSKGLRNGATSNPTALGREVLLNRVGRLLERAGL